MGHVWLTAAAWMGLALLASVLSVWSGISVALIEIFMGALAANLVGLADPIWVDYLAGLGAIVLAFLAGAEMQWAAFRTRVWANLAIGTGAFLAPFVAVFLFTLRVADWTTPQALLAATALSTTSVALVYTIVSEAGHSHTEVGQIVLAARFINDIATVVALAVVTANLDYRLPLFIGLMLVAAWAVPKISPWFIHEARQGGELDIRFLAVVLLVLSGIGGFSGIEPVVPAYLMGLALTALLENSTVTTQLRAVAFAWFTPFYFLRAGSFLDFAQLPAIAATAGALFIIKIASKCAIIVPLGRSFGLAPRDRWSIALLMSTGLTFGTVASYVGLVHGIIDRDQYAALVAAVIASGTIPALIAQKLLRTAEPAPDAH
jgi:Kef-type K+ transport system membrane component KefB